jgi:hypothetical protein
MKDHPERNLMRPRSHRHTITTRVRRVWNELDYAQRRMFEARTGVPVTDPSPRRRRDEHHLEVLDDLSRRGLRH